MSYSLSRLPIGPIVVPFGGSYLEPYKVVPKKNYYGDYGPQNSVNMKLGTWAPSWTLPARRARRELLISIEAGEEDFPHLTGFRV